VRLKDIVRRKNTNKIIEILIFMVFFSVFYNIIVILPPIIGGPIFALNSLEFLIQWFPFALVPFYILMILKIYKQRKKIKKNLGKRLEVEDVLHRHRNIMQKMTDGQSDMETHSHGEIK
jgi:membrane protein implicated in regulation of membrane protease activity